MTEEATVDPNKEMQDSLAGSIRGLQQAYSIIVEAAKTAFMECRDEAAGSLREAADVLNHEIQKTAHLMAERYSEEGLPLPIVPPEVAAPVPPPAVPQV